MKIFNIQYSIFSILLIILFSLPVSALNASQKPIVNRVSIFFEKRKTKKLYETKQYYAAAQALEKELAGEKVGNPVEIWKKIGLCYLNINQPQKALNWLQMVVNSGNADADIWYRYGLALQQTAAYHEAAAAFEQCLIMKPGYPMAQVKIESCKFAMNYNRVNPFSNFTPAVGVNTAGGEFGVSLYGNIAYFSLAAAPVAGLKIDQRTGLQHVQTYMMRRQNKRFAYPLPADNTLPKHLTDGQFAYDSIARCIYFAYCNPANNRCGIFSSKLAGGRWSDPEEVYLNKKGQVSGHPAIANGGNRLYFSSNFSIDETGQTDIWYIDKSTDGIWGAPINVGTNINTLGREEYPFVYADTLLFFASDGHVGYGGLDIFCSVIKGNTFSPPVNLRRPFNSPGDDFNLVISGNTGIFSSSRNESVSDDLYFFDGLPSFLYLSGHVTDMDTGDVLDRARLTLTIDGKAAQHTISDSAGYYGFFLRNDESPLIYARMTSYKPSITDVPKINPAQFADLRVDVRMKRSIIPPANILLYNKITGIPVSERAITCFNNDGEVQILRTDASGTFKLTMQEDQREYWIRFPDGNFLTESILLNEDQEKYSMAVQPINEKFFDGWMLFKRGSMEAVEMSQALIPRIASVINANRGMVFQIEGFCDTGFEVNQQHLAIQRAEYVVRRLIDEGVNPHQLVAIAGVEEETTIEEEAYQRRVEIKIYK